VTHKQALEAQKRYMNLVNFTLQNCGLKVPGTKGIETFGKIECQMYNFLI